MTPKTLTAFRLSPEDLRRLQKLAQKKERSKSDIVREAIKRFAAAEGIK
jgi:predicted DNA-binding protein